MPPKNVIEAALDELARREDTYSIADAPLPEPPTRRGPSQRGLVPIRPPRAALRDTVSIEDAREMIAGAMEAYRTATTHPHMLLVQAPPGVGKTTLGVQLAERHASGAHRVLYAGPRHDLFGDIRAASAVVGHISPASFDRWWYEWQPRNHLDAAGEPDLCRHATTIGRWLDRGYSGMGFCSGVCSWRYVNEQCLWHAQKAESQPIIFGQHGHLAGGHPLMKQISLIIGDENPLDTFLHNWQIPRRFIVPDGMDIREPLTELLHDLAGVADRVQRAEGRDLLNLLGGATRVHESCTAINLSLGLLEPRIHAAWDVDDMPYAHVLPLARALLREAEAAQTGREYPHRVYVANGDLHLLRRRPFAAEARDTPLIWLDGTGNPHIYETLFGRPVEVIAPNVQLHSRIFQVWDRTNGKGSVIDTKTGKLTEKATQLKQQIDRVVQVMDYQRPAVISFKDVMALFAVDDHGHFGSARGTNRFVDCDALIVAGTPQPPLLQLDRDARMLYHDRMQPFQLEYYDAPRPFAYRDARGHSYAYPVSDFQHDPDLHALLWQKRDAELIQAAHRVRPVVQRSGVQPDIWLLTNVPLDALPPTLLLTIRDLFGAPDGVDPYRWGDIVTLADLFYEQGQALFARDFVQHLGVSAPTARHYLDCIEAAQPERWTTKQEKVLNPKGGRAARGLTPIA